MHTRQKNLNGIIVDFLVTEGKTIDHLGHSVSMTHAYYSKYVLIIPTVKI